MLGKEFNSTVNVLKSKNDASHLDAFNINFNNNCNFENLLQLYICRKTGHRLGLFCHFLLDENSSIMKFESTLYCKYSKCCKCFFYLYIFFYCFQSNSWLCVIFVVYFCYLNNYVVIFYLLLYA